MAQTLKEKIDKNIPWLDNYQKGKDAQDIKTGSEGILEMMKKNDTYKYNDDILNYIKSAKKFRDKFEKNDDIKIKEMLKTFQAIEEEYKKRDKINKEKNKPTQENSKIPQKDFVKQNQQGKKPKLKKAQNEQQYSNNNHSSNSDHFTSKIEENINNSLQNLNTKIQLLSNNNASNEIQMIKKKLDSLKDDLSFEIKQQFEKRKDSYEQIEMLPAKLEDLSKKIDNIKISSVSTSSVNLQIPKDEQAVVDLTKYMKDGLEQFENIARYYITKQSEFDKREKENQKNQDSIKKSEDNAFKEGAKLEKISLAKEIFKKFPEKFNEIKSVFGEIVVEEYKENDEIDITKENRQKYEVKINGIKTESKVIIKTPAMFIDGECIKPATIKEDS